MEPSRSTSPAVQIVTEGEKLPNILDRSTSFHQGGTVDDITWQISHLDTSLHDSNPQNQLVVDKYLKECGLQYEDDEEEFGYGRLVIDYKPPKPITKAVTDKEQEIKEVKKFAGMYSVRTALQPTSHNPFEKNVLKWKTNTNKRMAEKSKGMKPMLVELHVFPGYEEHELTPLPPPLVVKEVLGKVVNGKTDLKRKPRFKRYLVSLLMSKMSEAVTQDIFWWYFLDKYQSDKKIQELIFNRIAHNYVKLFFMAPLNEFRDTFFKCYPNLVSQAVYCTFCLAFPTSYKQFDTKFKEDLLQLVYQWMVGTKPVPHLWDKWNMNVLEPPDMRKDEQIKKDASKGSLVNLPVDLTEENLSTQSSKNLPQIVESKSNMLDNRSSNISNTKRKLMAHSSINKESSSFLSLPEDKQDISNRMSLDSIAFPASATSRTTVKESYTSMIQQAQRNAQKKRESHPVGKGPEFNRSVFDVYGHSPLVEQFLKTHRLAKDAGTGILVQRTEITALPPLEAETYKEFIKKSFKKTKEMCSSYKRLHEEDLKKRSQFARKHKKGYHDYVRRQNDLLSRQKEVKKISDLLVLELMKDGDEQSSGKAAAAISAAMGFTLPENKNS